MITLHLGDAVVNRDRLVEELAVSLRDNQKKILYIVYEPALRVTVQELLAKKGFCALVPNPIVTVDKLLESQAATIHPTLAELYLKQILKEEKDNLEVFSNVNPNRLSRPLLRFITELKRSGITPTSFATSLKDSLNTEKNRDLVKIYQSFDLLLKEKGYALKEENAWERVHKKELFFGFDTVILDGFYLLEPLDKALIKNLASQENIETHINFAYYDKEPFRALKDDLVFLRTVCDKEEISLSRSISEVYAYRPKNPENECKYVLKEIKKLFWEDKITHTDDVLILTNNVAFYRPIFERLCQREELAFRRGPMSLSQTNILQELKLLIAFLTRPVEKEELLALLSGKYFDFGNYLAEGVSKTRLSNMLKSIKLIGKNDSWWKRLKRMSVDSKECEEVYNSLRRLDSKLKIIDKGSAKEISESLLKVLKDLKVDENLLLDVGDNFDQIIELRAWMEAKESLRNIAELSDEVFLSEEFLQAWLSNILASKINIIQDGLSVHDFNEGLLRQSKYIFLLGVSEDDLPKKPFESWVFNDKERLLLLESGLELKTTDKKESIQDYYYWQTLRAATERVYLLSPCEIGGKFKEQSFYVDEIDIFGKDKDEVVKIPELEPYYTSIEEKLEYLALTRSPSLPYELQEDIDHYTELSEGKIIYPDLAYLKGDDSDKATISVTAFSTYANCPYRFFVTKCLGIWEQEELTEEVTSLEGGSIWHKILELLYQEVKERGKDIVLLELDTILADLVKTVFDSYSASDFFKKVEQEKYLHGLRAFIEEDLKRDNFQPVFLEVSFGGKEKIPGVEVGPYMLSGIIDRVDYVSNNNQSGYIVYDYKRSKKEVYDLRKGKDYQLIAYIWALKQAGYEPVLGGSYVSFRGEENRFWSDEAFLAMDQTPPRSSYNKKEFAYILEDLLNEGEKLGERLSLGDYSPDYNSDSCRFCKFTDLCRKKTRGGDEISDE